MNLREYLNNFYQTYNIPEEGGIDDKTFEVPLPFFTLVLPNFSWRKRMLYVHDLEHILNNQDTTWQGEIFIASWEISTGFLKNFPILLFPLWTMGWGLWAHPKSVFRGFRKGNTDKGIAHLDIEKTKLLELDLFQLQQLTLNKRENRPHLFYFFKFLGWSVLSQLIFLSPVLAILLIAFALKY